MRDREILETYLNSVSKNTPETDIFPHWTKYLLTSVTEYDRDVSPENYKHHSQMRHRRCVFYDQYMWYKIIYPYTTLTRYQQQIFQPTRKAILLLCLILNV